MMKLLEIPRMCPKFYDLPMVFHDLEHVIVIITLVNWHLASLEEELHSQETIRANVRVMRGLRRDRIGVAPLRSRFGWCLGICMSVA